LSGKVGIKVQAHYNSKMNENPIKTKKSLKQKKIVVGFTGRLDSLVAAYLLKKQGYQVLAVAVNFAPLEPEMIKEDPEDEESSDIEAPFYGVNLVPDLTEIKKIAVSIGVNFYAVDASAEYKSLITDRIVAARLAGISFCPQYFAHSLLLSTLYKKSISLEASHIATGHFAKVSSLEGKSPLRVLSSNDLAHDQSDLLALVEKDILAKLLLPLSDMRKNEVEKVAASLKLLLLAPKKTWDEIQAHPGFADFIARRLPRSMIKDGQLIDFLSERIIGDHSGIHRHYIGQSNIKFDGVGTVDVLSTVATIQYNSGSIVVMKPEDILVERIVLNELIYSAQEDLSKPIALFMKRINSSVKVKGTFHFKNNRCGEFVLSEPLHAMIGRGETVVFLAHEKEGAKLVVCAQVYMAGSDIRHKLSILPEKEDDFLHKDDHDKPIADFYY
jgi:tRNA-specific 2-thiouridylase